MTAWILAMVLVSAPVAALGAQSEQTGQGTQGLQSEQIAQSTQGSQSEQTAQDAQGSQSEQIAEDLLSSQNTLEKTEATTIASASGSGYVSGSAKEAPLRVHLAGMPGDPVPAEVMDTDTASLLKLISEGLVVLDENGEPVPGCAREWKVSDDGLKWTFTLRDDLCWSDGESMDAQDFEKMFRRIADPATEALYGHDLMKNIAGYEEVLNGDPDALQVHAENDDTFVVELSVPDPSFARTCAAWALLPIREQIEEDSPKLSWSNITGNGPYVIASEKLSVPAVQEEYGSIISLEDIPGGQVTAQAVESSTQSGDSDDTGTSELEGRGYILKKNPYYQSERQPFDEVHWIVEGDVNQEYSDLLNGDFDAVISEGEQDTSVSSAVLRKQTVPDTIGILFNCRQEALQDPLVRSALSIAADRDYIASHILGGVYEPSSEHEFFEMIFGLAEGGNTEISAEDDEAEEDDAEISAGDEAEEDDAEESVEDDGAENNAPAMVFAEAADQENEDSAEGGGLDEVPDSLKGSAQVFMLYAEDSPEEDDSDYITEAAKLLKEAGYEDGDGFPVLTCLADENGGAYPIAEYLAAEWAKLGIELRVEKAGAKDLAQEKEKGMFDVVCGNLYLASDLPAGELEKYTAEHEENISGFSSEKYDELIEEAQQTSEETKYEKKMQQAVQVLKEELPAAPLAAKSVSWLQLEKHAGILCDSSGCWQLWNAPADGGSEISAQTLAEEPAVQEVTGNKTDPAAESAAVAGADLTAETEANIDAEGVTNLAVAEDPSQAQFEPAPGSYMDQMISSDSYYMKTDQDAWLTSQAYILDEASEDAGHLVSLPKYTAVHLTGIGSTGYVRLSENGRFCYLEADKVTLNKADLEEIRMEEKAQDRQIAKLSQSMHLVKEKELKSRAAGIRAEMEEVLAEIAFQEMLRTQTRNPNWDGPVLSKSNGSIYGPSGKETYYNLNMSGVVNIMRRMGNTDEYWVRDDGCKMLGNYIMCAANLRVHPRGSLVECSLGTCIVCDTGGFASGNSHQLDIAVTW